MNFSSIWNVFSRSAPVSPEVSSYDGYSVYKTVRDENGVFTEIEYQLNGNLYKRSILSGGTSPYYTTRTDYIYVDVPNNPGSTYELRQRVYTLTYNEFNELVSEEENPAQPI